MGVVNSFTENTNNLLKQVNIALESLVQLNNSLTTENDSVTFQVEGLNPVTGDPSLYTYTIPSYPYILDQLNKTLNTVDTFISGQGVVLLNDGTYREVKTIPLASPPPKITNVATPSKFYTRANWFFESFMFPQTFVRFDLKGKIDDRADRIQMKRVIFDNFDDEETQWFIDNFVGKDYTYYDAITLLNDNNKRYWADDDIIYLPIRTAKYTGDFIILDKKIISNNNWYYLNTVNYGLVSDASIVKNIELKVGDQLRYGSNSLFKIDEIVITEKRIRVTPTVGSDLPTINNRFLIYSTPFEQKLVDIAIGYDECNILFLKGINDDFNLLGSEWSTSINFYTNSLLLNGTVSSYETFYLSNVVDFGRQMEGQAKEKFVPAFFGVKPDAPTISVNQFKVNQINTQINAALDTESIKNTQTQIENTKSIINSLKNTISQQKSELVELTDAAQRSDLQSKIDLNTNRLSKRSVEYQSLVRSLSTIAYENDAVVNNPKYRIRGFFDIPAAKKTSENSNEKPQEIIQFDVAYRYLKLDGTGNPLNTYTFIDPSTSQPVTGTFTDWNIRQSPIKSRIYDASRGEYVWKNENIQDGQEVNINQVDIPITKGEKVQLRVRSISEAGWPNNPKKSDWSDPVIVDFPSNLKGSEQGVNILADAQEEETSIKLDETLGAVGVNSHLEDSVPNPNTGEGTYFKHQARFLAYDLAKKSMSNETYQEITTDLQTVLSNLGGNTYVTITKPVGATSTASQLTGTLQKLLQAIVNTTPGIYDNFETEITT